MSRPVDRGPQPPGPAQSSWRPRGQTLVDELTQFVAAGVHRSNVGPHAEAEPVQSWRFVLHA